MKILRYYWLLKCISGLWDARVLTTTIADYLHTALKARSIKIMSSVQHLGLNPIVAAVLACLIGWLWVLNQESNQLTLIRWQGLKYFELLNSWANIWHHALLLSHVFIYLCFSKTLNTFFYSFWARCSNLRLSQQRSGWCLWPSRRGRMLRKPELRRTWKDPLIRCLCRLDKAG